MRLVAGKRWRNARESAGEGVVVGRTKGETAGTQLALVYLFAVDRGNLTLHKSI